MTQYKKQIVDYVNNYMQLLSKAIVLELNEYWDEYMYYLRSLPDKEQKRILEMFKVSSLDDIKVDIISNELSEDAISIQLGINRHKDSRILEYIYGKRTPLNKLITKLHLPNGLTMLIRKHGMVA